MAYNKRNLYRRIIKIQDITLERQEADENWTYRGIYENYIASRFDISLRTYTKYLGIPAKRLLSELESGKKAGKERLPGLFDEIEGKNGKEEDTER